MHNKIWRKCSRTPEECIYHGNCYHAILHRYDMACDAPLPTGCLCLPVDESNTCINGKEIDICDYCSKQIRIKLTFICASCKDSHLHFCYPECGKSFLSMNEGEIQARKCISAIVKALHDYKFTLKINDGVLVLIDENKEDDKRLTDPVHYNYGKGFDDYLEILYPR